MRKNLQTLPTSKIKKQYKIIFDYSLAAICTHDLDGNVLNVNPYATELLQYSYDELKGRNIADLVPEKFKSDVQVQYLDVIRKKQLPKVC